jgi:hypothetical protein
LPERKSLHRVGAGARSRHAYFCDFAFWATHQWNNKEYEMKTKLLISVAMAALIAGTAGALAQEEKGGGAGGAKSGAAQHEATPGGAGGAMQHGASPGSGAQLQGKPQGGASEQHSVQGGPADERSGTGMQRGTEQNQPGKAGVNAQEHAQTQPGAKTDQNAQTQDRNKTQENAQTQEKGGQSQQNAATGKASGGKSAQLSDTQRTQIKDIVVKDRNVARVDHVDFSVNVGVAVPRSVHVAVLPTDIVEIVPEYRGFDYVIVGEQLLIIDPNTMLIVDVLPV